VTFLAKGEMVSPMGYWMKVRNRRNSLLIARKAEEWPNRLLAGALSIGFNGIRPWSDWLHVSECLRDVGHVLRPQRRMLL
jgi:hypothetical protein